MPQETIAVLDKFTGETISRVPASAQEDVRRAVGRAQEAFA